MMIHAYLNQEYVRFFSDFEKLVQSQMQRRDTLVDVPFAKQLIAQLQSRGFSEKESLRYFALFYQLHRAFYFITRALVGDSPSMKQLRLALWNNVFTYDVGLYDQHLCGTVWRISPPYCLGKPEQARDLQPQLSGVRVSFLLTPRRAGLPITLWRHSSLSISRNTRRASSNRSFSAIVKGHSQGL